MFKSARFFSQVSVPGDVISFVFIVTKGIIYAIFMSAKTEYSYFLPSIPLIFYS